MQTLARLAGEDTFDLSKNVDYLAGGIKSHPKFGIDAKHVDAISNISKVIIKWITSIYQERAIKSMVMESDADLQTILDGMKSLVRYYKKTNENERKRVLGVFDINLPFLHPSKDKLLATLARIHRMPLEADYDAAEKRYDDIEKGINSISEGHTKILENINLSIDEAKDLISKISKDIMKCTLKIGQDDKLRTGGASKRTAEVSPMPNKRKRHTPEFKAKVSLDAIKGMKTASELASQYTTLI